MRAGIFSSHPALHGVPGKEGPDTLDHVQPKVAGVLESPVLFLASLNDIPFHRQ